MEELGKGLYIEGNTLYVEVPDKTNIVWERTFAASNFSIFFESGFLDFTLSRNSQKKAIFFGGTAFPGYWKIYKKE